MVAQLEIAPGLATERHLPPTQGPDDLCAAPRTSFASVTFDQHVVTC